MSPGRDRDPSDDTIRTHVDAAVDRATEGLRAEVKLVGQSVESLRREMGLELRAVVHRIEGGTKASGDRFEAHKNEDNARFAGLHAANERRDDAAKEALLEVKSDIKELAGDVKKIGDSVAAAALREASLAGKVAGAALAGSAIFAALNWLLGHAPSLLGH